MKKKNRMETFPLRCGRENGNYLELNIPMSLYGSFECTISTNEGRGVLVKIFSKLEELDNAGRDTFQMLLLEETENNNIHCICELSTLLDAVIEAIMKSN